MADITITLPDASTREVPAGATVGGLAAAIARGLAKKAVIGSVTGTERNSDRAVGLRVDGVDASENLGNRNRIRTAKGEKVPCVLVVGDDDLASRSVGVNPRGGEVDDQQHVS